MGCGIKYFFEQGMNPSLRAAPGPEPSRVWTTYTDRHPRLALDDWQWRSRSVAPGHHCEAEEIRDELIRVILASGPRQEPLPKLREQATTTPSAALHTSWPSASHAGGGDGADTEGHRGQTPG